jgi:hypothetical protein
MDRVFDSSAAYHKGRFHKINPEDLNVFMAVLLDRT